MNEFSFEALGTQWSILTDADLLKEEDKDALLRVIDAFDQRFSRFKPASEVMQFADATKGEYAISPDLASMLKTAERLRSLTDGIFDPAIGKLMEHTGYDAQYRFTKDERKIKEYHIPKWSVSDATLSLESGVIFDIGGIGKGLCIDLVARFLQKQGYRFFLVDAGGDMFATHKQDGTPFQIALEWPGKPEVAFGTIALLNQGLAVSDTFRRRWQAWNHIINPVTKKPVTTILGCAAIAKNAYDADCMTSGLFFASEERYSKLAVAFQSEFIVFQENNQVRMSEGWPGKFFGEESKKE